MWISRQSTLPWIGLFQEPGTLECHTKSTFYQWSSLRSQSQWSVKVCARFWEKINCLVFRTFKWPSLSNNRFSGFMSLLQHSLLSFTFVLHSHSLTLSATCRWWRGSEDTQGRTQSQRRRRRRWGRRTSQSWATSWRINIQAAKMTKWIFKRMMMSVFCCEPPKNLPPQSNSIPRMTLIWTKYTETCHHLLGKPPKREMMVKSTENSDCLV